MGAFSAVLCLPASWEGRHSGKRLRQEPEPREWHTGSSCAPRLRATKNGHHVPLEQQCQSAGTVTGPRSAWALSPKGAFRTITGHFSCREQPGGCAHPILPGCPSPLAQGHLPTSVLLCQKKSACQGTSSRHWGRVCGNGDLQLLLTNFLPQARLWVSLSPSNIPGAAPRSGLCSSMQGR